MCPCFRLSAIYPRCIPHSPAKGGTAPGSETSSMITPHMLMDLTTTVHYPQKKPKSIVSNALNPTLSTFTRWMTWLLPLGLCYRDGAPMCFTMFVSTILSTDFSFIFNDLHTSVVIQCSCYELTHEDND